VKSAADVEPPTRTISMPLPVVAAGVNDGKNGNRLTAVGVPNTFPPMFKKSCVVPLTGDPALSN
jgi:hypothetical protein